MSSSKFFPGFFPMHPFEAPALLKTFDELKQIFSALQNMFFS